MYTQGFEFTNFTGKNFSNGCGNGFLGFSAKDRSFAGPPWPTLDVALAPSLFSLSLLPFTERGEDWEEGRRPAPEQGGA